MVLVDKISIQKKLQFNQLGLKDLILLQPIHQILNCSLTS